MARNWVRKGHQVTMLAEIPNHPAGIIFPEYRGKLVERSNLEGIDVIRMWVKASPKKNFANRMMFYISFMINSALAGMLLARGKYDMIFASSPPLFVGGSALALSLLRRIPFVFEVRDMWPESAIELGELTSEKAIKLATRLEEACYNRARVIVAVTNYTRNKLIERGISNAEHKVIVIPNGANVDQFQFRALGRDKIRQEYGLEDKFVVVYAGIHGIAQGLDTVIKTAKKLEHRKDIHFLLVGDGPKKAELEELAAEYNLENLTMIPHQPNDRIPDFLSAGDSALIPLRKIPLFKGVHPSKMFDAWACNRPILLSIDGEARQIMEEANAGLFIPPEDPDEMANAILSMQAEPINRDQMGNRGRTLTENHFSRQVLAEQLIEKLEKTII
ncbi:MAG: glycosyltransferase family 4 protein [Anaerolineales bacterium]|nr:glycosyltransferase family 4 protein [Anaerolineales bacterium]